MFVIIIEYGEFWLFPNVC